MPGIEPGASYMQSMRSTTELHPPPSEPRGCRKWRPFSTCTCSFLSGCSAPPRTGAGPSAQGRSPPAPRRRRRPRGAMRAAAEEGGFHRDRCGGALVWLVLVSIVRLPRCGHNRCSSSCHHLEVRFPPQWRSVLPQAWNVPEVLLLEEANGSNSQDNVEKAEQA